MSPVSSLDRMSSAEVRAIDAHKSVARKAREIMDELDDVTDVGSRVPVEVHEEDSAVIALEAGIDQHKAVAAGVVRRGA